MLDASGHLLGHEERQAGELPTTEESEPTGETSANSESIVAENSAIATEPAVPEFDQPVAAKKPE